ncbi:hypothetical protein FNV43_RR13277 [Rhamnella rubrinervis]|uniref:Uncharacterized protein n=1 Tax=Rhamnella rubrinervis TaxID=2594499 RepID=A0A8K0H0U6_9ROSA|nr:hypothetical protein FNV43_RR13277 [Rhamnella rubrinervis]
MHDLSTGHNITAHAIAGVPQSKWWTLGFGTAFACDDKLTGPTTGSLTRLAGLKASMSTLHWTVRTHTYSCHWFSQTRSSMEALWRFKELIGFTKSIGKCLWFLGLDNLDWLGFCNS